MNPSTDTPHCDVTDAQAIRVRTNGTFTAHFRVETGIIGDGYCATPGHPSCVIGVGNAQGQGTVVKITFKNPAPATTGFHHLDHLLTAVRPLRRRAATPGGCTR